MRRRVTLYIDGQRADTSEQALILFNHAATDLDKPTAVKNSYSQQVTLPGTANNASIFGGYARPDRVTGAGGFNALQKTPFAIYDELSQVLERGYLRLDSVERQGDIVTGYKVTLFGGLGTFLYGLSYTDSGAKMTLADLDYLGTPSPEGELDLKITASAVRAAWARLASNPASVSGLYDIINFAPCYEGVPEGDFDADKGYGYALPLNLDRPAGYRTDEAGGTRVNFAQALDMWSAHDLRCYLQRPVLSMRALLAAIQRRAAVLGYTFDYSQIPSAQYETLWKTLPSIPSLGSFNKADGDLAATIAQTSGTTDIVATWNITGLQDMAGIDLTAKIGFTLSWAVGQTASTLTLMNNTMTEASVVFLQMVAWDSNGRQCGYSDVTMLAPQNTILNPASLAAFCGYQPAGQPGYNAFNTVTSLQGGRMRIPEDLFITLRAVGAVQVVLYADAYLLTGYLAGGTPQIDSATYMNGSLPALWYGATRRNTTMTFVAQSSTPNVISYTSPDSPRSGALLTKAMLLNSKYSPAEYLLSLAKQFGWKFCIDEGLRKVSLMPREEYYTSGEPDIDLSEWIDRSKPVTILPLRLESKWYEFLQPMAEGAFAKEYKGIYGLDYGIQRVNTGYDFDAASINLLEGSAMRAAVSKQAHGPYWDVLLWQGDPLPTPFLTSGNTYTLWSTADGAEKNFDVPAYSASDSDVTLESYNTALAGYDADRVTRLELCDAGGKPIDGEDILCRYHGQVRMPYLKLSDDTTQMLLANNGRPCWSLAVPGPSGESVPTFSRYGQQGGVVNDMLDFGVPKEVDIPGIAFADGVTMYALYWQGYLADLLDVDTKVMRCHVNLERVQVNAALLRRFFWYEGCWWVLNKITNYSLTTFDTTECEFVQVRNKNNYNGQ